MDSERRHAPRYSFIADAEVTELSSDTKLIAKTSDLSVGGCSSTCSIPHRKEQTSASRFLTKTAPSPRSAERFLSFPIWAWESFSALLLMTSKRFFTNG